MLTMIGAINEFERQNLLERQREGIAIAKARGKYKGRCPVQVDSQKWQLHLKSTAPAKSTSCRWPGCLASPVQR